MAGSDSVDYPGYDKVIEQLSKETFETQIQKGAAFIGTPDEINEQIANYHALTGGFEIASLQVNFNDIDVSDAEASMRLFSEKVIPNFQNKWFERNVNNEIFYLSRNILKIIPHYGVGYFGY